MKLSDTLVWLALLIVVLAVFATAAGLFWQDGGTPFAFTSLRGETVQMYAEGLYKYDSRLIGTGFKVQDAVTLVLGIPLLGLSIILYRRGSLRGGLLLTGVLLYFLYNYASMALGAAYNNLFLVYVALFSISFFACMLAFAGFDVEALPSHFAKNVQWRGISIFLIVSGLILFSVWLFLSILPALLEGTAPMLESYTTQITWVVDMGILAPALIVTGLLLRRRAAVGYLLASTLVIFSAVLGIQLAAMGIVQFAAGLFGVGQLIGMVATFAILALFALWFTFELFRSVSESVTLKSRSAKLRAAASRVRS